MSTKIFSIVLFTSIFMLYSSCVQKPAEAEGKEDSPAARTEFDMLMQYLVDNGNYVTGRNFPSMIKPATVYEELGPELLVIDLRSAETFALGHIKNAQNVKFTDLPFFFRKDIKPFQYDKIVLVCDHGQMSSYATSLLRLMGYGNVYSMRWGMDVWHPDIAARGGWGALVSDRFEKALEIKVNEKSSPGAFPVLSTGKSTGEEILEARIQSLFEKGSREVWIQPEEVFDAPADYFVINFDRRDKYESGHIPGAIRYKPNGTLGFPDEMRTIPADRDVVVYCGTGQNSAFAAAYLRLLGYRAHSLIYGNNGFMHGKMQQEKDNLSWQAYGSEYMHAFPYVTGR